jgi:CRISPR/Cas system CSM-associated protein Csm2 small subunit
VCILAYRAQPRLSDQVAQSIESDEKLYEIVDQIMKLPEYQIKRILGGTSTTAYRRVHERLASSIDKILEKLRNYKNVKDINVRDIAGTALSDLTRSLILLRYQNARGQISDDLRSILESIVSKLVNDIKSLQSSDSEKLKELRKKLERARSLIDAIAVLAYEYGK